MLYALVGSVKQKAEPSIKGKCPFCKEVVIPRCGEIRINHWSHLKSSNCLFDSVHETEWHLNWKSKFPSENCEVKIHSESKYHIADVLTPNSIVIEFQNSPISVETIKIREAFYENMIWVVNGLNFKKNISFSRVPEKGKIYPRNLKYDKDYRNKPCFVLDLKSKSLDKNSILSITRSGMIYDRLDHKIYIYTPHKSLSWSSANFLHKINERLNIFDLTDNQYYFKWSYKVESWKVAKLPVFLDFSDGYLYWIKNWIDTDYGIVQKVSISKFLQKYNAPLQEIQK